MSNSSMINIAFFSGDDKHTISNSLHVSSILRIAESVWESSKPDGDPPVTHYYLYLKYDPDSSYEISGDEAARIRSAMADYYREPEQFGEYGLFSFRRTKTDETNALITIALCNISSLAAYEKNGYITLLDESGYWVTLETLAECRQRWQSYLNSLEPARKF